MTFATVSPWCIGRWTSRARIVAAFASLSLASRLTAQADPGATATQHAVRASAQPGDLVIVKVYREPDLSDTVTVDPAGTIVLARIGSINVASLAIGVLADTLRGRYARFLRKPDVELAVLRRIVVNGEVQHPNVYYVDIVSTVRDVIARAGGITDAGNPGDVDVVRHGTRSRIANWEDDVSVASELNSGDQIVVNRRSWLYRNIFSAVSTVAVLVSLYVSLRR